MTNEDQKEPKYQKLWRPLVAYCYLFFCILDFGVRPLINYHTKKSFDLAETVEIIQKLPPATQIEVLRTGSNGDIMAPILDQFSHLAFGSIIGVTAFTRGQEKIERLRNIPLNSPPQTPPPVEINIAQPAIKPEEDNTDPDPNAEIPTPRKKKTRIAVG